MKEIFWKIYYDVLPIAGIVVALFLIEFTFFYYPKKLANQMTMITHKLNYLITELTEFDEKMNKFEDGLYHSKNKKIIGISITITAYTPTKDQCDSTPFITASNIRVREGIIALSRDLEKEFNLKFGDFVEIVGIGTFEFQDRMHKRWKRKVDIFMLCRKEAIKFGKKIGKLNIL